MNTPEKAWQHFEVAGLYIDTHIRNGDDIVLPAAQLGVGHRGRQHGAEEDEVDERQLHFV